MALDYYKHGPHPFEWVAKGVKGMHQNLWKDTSFELLSFFYPVCRVVGEGKETWFWKDQWVGNRALSIVFPRLYYLSSFKNCLVTSLWFLTLDGELCVFFLWFRRRLSNRVTTVLPIFFLYLLKVEEDLDHFLCGCQFARILWNCFF